jgi:hypothetical protein
MGAVADVKQPACRGVQFPQDRRARSLRPLKGMRRLRDMRN